MKTLMYPIPPEDDFPDEFCAISQGSGEHWFVRCRDCEHANKGGTLCNFFASWVPVAGGDEYEDMPAEVEPDGFCKWGKRREDK